MRGSLTFISFLIWKLNLEENIKNFCDYCFFFINSPQILGAREIDKLASHYWTCLNQATDRVQRWSMSHLFVGNEVEAFKEVKQKTMRDTDSYSSLSKFLLLASNGIRLNFYQFVLMDLQYFNRDF